MYELFTAENEVSTDLIQCCNSVQNLPRCHVKLDVGYTLLILVDITCYSPIIFMAVQSVAV